MTFYKIIVFNIFRNSYMICIAVLLFITRTSEAELETQAASRNFAPKIIIRVKLLLQCLPPLSHLQRLWSHKYVLCGSHHFSRRATFISLGYKVT